MKSSLKRRKVARPQTDHLSWERQRKKKNVNETVVAPLPIEIMYRIKELRACYVDFLLVVCTVHIQQIHISWIEMRHASNSWSFSFHNIQTNMNGNGNLNYLLTFRATRCNSQGPQQISKDHSHHLAPRAHIHNTTVVMAKLSSFTQTESSKLENIISEPQIDFCVPMIRPV